MRDQTTTNLARIGIMCMFQILKIKVEDSRLGVAKLPLLDWEISLTLPEHQLCLKKHVYIGGQL